MEVHYLVLNYSPFLGGGGELYYVYFTDKQRKTQEDKCHP